MLFHCVDRGQIIPINTYRRGENDVSFECQREDVM